MDEKHKSPLKSEVAQHKLRDEEGHFIHLDPPQSPSSPQQPLSSLNKFLLDHTHYDKKQDDLLDVHIGNPLRKITLVLEEIKKQKAFSFTLKGSLGIMGVFLALSIFGIFGGSKLLCDRGVQTHIGTLKTLSVVETEVSNIPLLSSLISLISPITPLTHHRTVLITQDKTLDLPPSSSVPFSLFINQSVIVTGNYDACSQTLKVTDPAGVEVYSRL